MGGSFETSMIPIDAEFHKESIPHHPRARSWAKKAEHAKQQQIIKIVIFITFSLLAFPALLAQELALGWWGIDSL